MHFICQSNLVQTPKVYAHQLGQYLNQYQKVKIAVSAADKYIYKLTHVRVFDHFRLDNQCVRPPYGVVYLATRKNYVGSNSGARHLRNLVDEEGIFGAHSVKEFADRDIWKFFLK